MRSAAKGQSDAGTNWRGPIRRIRAALRHLKDEALFAFGAEGDECIQALVALEARLQGRQIEIFQAFHQGLKRQQDGNDSPDPPTWSGPVDLRSAFETGYRTTRLNDQRRQDSGLNIGPLDMPRTQQLLARAVDALRPW